MLLYWTREEAAITIFWPVFLTNASTIYELNNPVLVLAVKKVLRRYSFRNNLTVINRQLFLYVMVPYNSSVQTLLMQRLSIQIPSVVRFTTIVLSSVLVSTILVLKYKLLINNPNLRYLSAALVFILLFSGGLTICRPDCSNVCYVKQNSID
jgi:hypothetical protein